MTKTEIVWQRHYSTPKEAWTAFQGACPWGETPQYLDVAALADARWDIVRIVALLRNAYRDACEECKAYPGPAPAPIQVVVKGDTGTVSYGQGRSSVEMCPYSGGGWLLTIRGPVEALESMSARVVGAGGPPWDTTTRWSPGDGWWMLPLDPAARATWLREQLTIATEV